MTSKGKAKHKYELRFIPEALKEWRRLHGALQANLRMPFSKWLDSPRVPDGELHGPLAGCYTITLRQQGVRWVYSVEDDPLLVTVLAVDKREDGADYESAMARLSAAATLLRKGLLEKR